MDAARAAYQQAIDSGHPEVSPAAAVDLGALLSEQQELEGATVAFQQALTLYRRAQDRVGEAEAVRALLIMWIQTPTWEESEAFLSEHQQDLVTADGSAILAAHAAANPDDEMLSWHMNLLNAAQNNGVAATYSQLREELAASESAAVVRGWRDCAPDWADSAAYLAEHADQLHTQAAVAALTAACEDEPGDTGFWLHLGLLLMGDQTSDGYAAVAGGNPDPFERAETLLASNRLDEALAWSCLARARNRGQGALLMAHVRLKRDQSNEAAEALATAAAEVSKDQLGKVLVIYDDLLRSQSDQPWLLAGYAAALARAERSVAALAAYERAINLAPDEASLHSNKGQLLFDLGRFDEAIPEFLDATRLRPGDILSPQVMLGAIAWPDSTERAREHFAAALSSPGEHLTPFGRAFCRATALAGLDRLDEAITELEAALPTRSMGDAYPEESDKRFLDRFRNPLLPGLEKLRQLLEAPHTGTVTGGES